jgi:hypothetical protein
MHSKPETGGRTREMTKAWTWASWYIMDMNLLLILFIFGFSDLLLPP